MPCSAEILDCSSLIHGLWVWSVPKGLPERWGFLGGLLTLPEDAVLCVGDGGGVSSSSAKDIRDLETAGEGSGVGAGVGSSSW